jgi:hypothetical protein
MPNRRAQVRPTLLRAAASLCAALLACTTLTGCLIVSYSSGSGWSISPASLGITLILIALMLYFNRR